MGKGVKGKRSRRRIRGSEYRHMGKGKGKGRTKLIAKVF